jgi:hypothetical protein
MTGAVETSDEFSLYLVPDIGHYEIPFNFSGKFGAIQKMKDIYDSVSGHFSEFKDGFDLLYRALGRMLLSGSNVLYYSKQGGVYFKTLLLDD